MIRDPDHLGLYQTDSGRWVLRQLVPEKLRAAAKRRFNISREFLVRLGDNRESAVRRLEAERALIQKKMGQLREDVAALAHLPAPEAAGKGDGGHAAEKGDADLLGFGATARYPHPPLDHAGLLAALDRWHQTRFHDVNASVLQGHHPDPREDWSAFEAAERRRSDRIMQLEGYDPRLHRDADAVVPGFDRAMAGALEQQGFNVPLAHPGLRPIRVEFRRVWLNILLHQRRWIAEFQRGAPPAPVPPPPFAWSVDGEPVPLSRTAAATAEPRQTGASRSASGSDPAGADMTFTALVEYHKNQTKAREDDLRPVRRWFLDVLGGDLPIREIRTSHVRQFRDLVLCVPSYRRGADRKLPLPKLAKRYRERVESAVQRLRVGAHFDGDAASLEDCSDDTLRATALFRPACGTPWKTSRPPI